jgi:hypothetical protein
MIEIQSQPDESDRARMLVQAACVARLGHTYRKHSNKPIIITAIYIDERGGASRCFLFVRDDSPTEVSKHVIHERR